jgi:DNA-directed RNA polymerase subunit alpha
LSESAFHVFGAFSCAPPTRGKNPRESVGFLPNGSLRLRLTVTEQQVDLRAMLVERDELEGSMVTKLREGLAQGPNQIRALKDIIDTIQKKLNSASDSSMKKKLHLKLGVLHFFSGHTQQSVEHLKQSDGPLAAYYHGRALVSLGDYPGAMQAFEKSEKSGYAAQSVQLQRAGVHRLQGELPQAKAILAKVKDGATHNAEYHYQEGALAEAEGATVRAIASYERSLQLDPTHPAALFRMAYLNDLAGNDYTAIELYETCLKHPPVGRGVLQNLGVLYEDNDRYDKALECYKRLLKADPRDEKARLFVRDAEAAASMYYSPDDEQVNLQLRQVMETPISDFELSVRSRNCLKRMNIRTLGDLTRVSEAQLLASKNFGDTSLDEIRIIMNMKNLRIGQSLEQGQQYEMRYRPQNNLTPEEQALLNRPVSDLNLTVRARKCMNRLQINTLGELVSRSTNDLMEAKNFGVTSLKEVQQKLSELGLKLRGG